MNESKLVLIKHTIDAEIRYTNLLMLNSNVFTAYVVSRILHLPAPQKPQNAEIDFDGT